MVEKLSAVLAGQAGRHGRGQEAGLRAAGQPPLEHHEREQEEGAERAEREETAQVNQRGHFLLRADAQ